LPMYRWSAIRAATATSDTSKIRPTTPTLAHEAAARAITHSTNLASGESTYSSGTSGLSE
jgi:hypothetical protein